MVRPRQPEALDAREDDARVGGAQRLVVQAQALHQPRREVLDDDVGVADHVQEERTALGLFQVQHNAALVVVEQQEVHRVEPRHLGTVAARLLAARRLDLEDVGAQPPEELGAGRPGFELGEVENANPAQRPVGHGHSPFGGRG